MYYKLLDMSQLRDILCGYGHHMFQYIKCLVDQTESGGSVYSVQWVLYGFTVIDHVYTLRLCHTHSIEQAKDRCWPLVSTIVTISRMLPE